MDMMSTSAKRAGYEYLASLGLQVPLHPTLLGKYRGPDHLTYLPKDIKAMIVAILDGDNDFHSIAHLMMSNKSWFDHLAHDDKAWQRRYRIIAEACRIGIMSSLLAWRVAVCRLLPKVCAGCHATPNVTSSILWPRHPAWARICLMCRVGNPYFFCLDYSSSEVRSLRSEVLQKLESGTALRMWYGPAVVLLME